MPLISVVIPVHGVEDYLDRCLDSVLTDSAASLEVIAVDDASPDRCGAILAARQDPRLRVLTTTTAAGPGPARDLGAKEATGEYIWFVDGDDEVADGALAAVAGALTRLRPDVLVIDFESLYPDGSVSPSGGAEYLRGSAAEPLRDGETGTLAHHPALIHLTMTAWSKVFRRDFLAGLVSRLRRAMRRAARAADPALGLSVAQLELLSCITEHPGIRPSQLARMLRLAPSSVATLLGGLQSAGYVTRTPGADSAGDRRTVSLDLSEAGTEAVTRWHRVNEDIIQAALADLPYRDRAALRDAAPALRDLTASIDAQAD